MLELHWRFCDNALHIAIQSAIVRGNQPPDDVYLEATTNCNYIYVICSRFRLLQNQCNYVNNQLTSEVNFLQT